MIVQEFDTLANIMKMALGTKEPEPAPIPKSKDEAKSMFAKVFG